MNKFKHIALVLGLVLVAFAANAQDKIGYISQAAILELMPEKPQLEQELQAYVQTIQSELGKKQQELQEKVGVYEQEKDGLPPSVRKVREEELMQLQQNLQTFQQNAQNDAIQKEQALIAPILEKIMGAINAVASEQGFTYVFDISAGNPIVKPAGGDMTAGVKAKLGIQ